MWVRQKTAPAELTQTCSVPRPRGHLWPISRGPKRWEQVSIAEPKYVQSCREKGGTRIGAALQRIVEGSLAIGVSVASGFINGMNKYMTISQRSDNKKVFYSVFKNY